MLRLCLAIRLTGAPKFAPNFFADPDKKAGVTLTLIFRYYSVYSGQFFNPRPLQNVD
jgi:hypothetical protein